jgi:nicotinamide mononucleotide transporter
MDLWHILNIAGAVSGLIYIWLEYRASVWLWVAGIVMPAIYIYIYFHEGIYANVGINVYFVLAGFYGLWAWLSGRSDGAEKPITRMSRRVWLPSMMVGAAITALLAWVLLRFTSSESVGNTLMDAFTTGFSVVGLWMLARKWAEQWLVWIVVDTVYTVLCLRTGLYYLVPVYAIFTIVAVLGYFQWKRRAIQPEARGAAKRV